MYKPNVDNIANHHYEDGPFICHVFNSLDQPETDICFWLGE